jgi:hypothetical protein
MRRCHEVFQKSESQFCGLLTAVGSFSVSKEKFLSDLGSAPSGSIRAVPALAAKPGPAAKPGLAMISVGVSGTSTPVLEALFA